MKMHKAIAVIQFKLDGQLIAEHPEYSMEDRRLLHRIDYEKGIINIDGDEYPLLDRSFPTIDPDAPYSFTPDEVSVVKKLQSGFVHCEKLQRAHLLPKLAPSVTK